MLAACLCVLVALFGASARAAPLPRYTVTEWTVREGAPSDVEAIEQTSDGFLWLAASTGLYRFDGVDFVRMQAPLYPIIPNELGGGLQAVDDGGLWIGARGRLILLRHGRIVRDDRLPPEFGRTMEIASDPVRGLVAITTKAMLRFDGHGWQRILPQGSDGPQATFFELYPASDGSLWLATSAGIFRQADADSDYVRRSDRADVGGFAETSDGSIWYQDFNAGLSRFAPSGTRDRWSADKGESMFVTGDDVALVASLEGVHVVRFPPTEPPDGQDGVARPFSSEPLTGDMRGLEATLITSDRENNIWISTFDGLMRLRPNRLVQPAGIEGTGGIAPGIDGRMALVSYGRGFMWADDKATPVPEVGTNLSFVHRDAGGVVWVGGRGRGDLLRMDKDGVSRLPLPEFPGNAYVTAVAVETGGAIWMSAYPGGVHRWDGQRWTDRGGFKELPEFPGAIVANAAGDVWMIATPNRVYRVRDGRVDFFNEAQGVSIGSAQAIAISGEALYIAGNEGINAWTGSGFRRIQARNDEFLGISSLLATRDGDLWVSQANGVLRVPRSELAGAGAGAGAGAHDVEVERFDYRDGLVGSASTSPPLPTIAEADDGRVWFTAGNVVHIDPKNIERNSTPPTAHVLTVDAGTGARPVEPVNRLELGARDLAIAFTATSFTDPSRVRFQYRFGGSDAAWRDGGTARQTRFTNLDPGTYEFAVKATNNDGVWSAPSAPVRFDVPPHVHEQTWFKVACVLAAILGLWLVIHLRSLQVASRVRGLLRERLLERERIARDLHDTLLQGVHGLVLQMQVMSDRLPPADPQRASIERAMDSADALIKEGRERVSDLRLNDASGDLGAYFRSVGAAFTGAEVTRLQVEETGRPRALEAQANLEIRRIVSEALINALRHANATTVALTIDYADRELCATVRDDGSGIPEDILAAGGRPGHWGLRSIKERAAGLGGRLEIRSSAATGTLYELRVPAAVAYPGSRGGWLSRLLRVMAPAPSKRSPERD